MLKRIGEVRSLISSSVHMMALTATATRSDRLAVTQTVGLRNPFVLTKCPTKANLVYHVRPFLTIAETFKVFAERLKNEKNKFPKTIIYGRSFGICADIYLYLKSQLGSGFVIPEDAPDIPEFRLVDMFTSLTEHIHKQQILSLFTNESNLRVVIATVAFGMGVDCSNVRQIIHIGLPDDVCCYILETGRAGRDGNTSVVTLLLSRTYHIVNDDIKQYAANKTHCRRHILFRDMENYVYVDVGIKCLCCDYCANSYVCGLCKANLKPFVLF